MLQDFLPRDLDLVADIGRIVARLVARRARPPICATLRPSGSGSTGAHATPT